MTNDYVTGVERMQRITRRPRNKHTWLQVAIYCVIFAGLMVVAGQSTTPPTPQPAVCHTACSGCHNPMSNYFRKAGSKTPEQMAEAVLATRNPRLLAAIHVAGEKCTPHTVRHGGYRHRYAGAWQVDARHWGPVSRDVTEQALQAELVITSLAQEHRGDIRRALNAYGGDSSGRYARVVLAELERTP